MDTPEKDTLHNIQTVPAVRISPSFQTCIALQVHVFSSSTMRFGVISAGDQTTLQTAQSILETGGNAFDAAVAAVFTSMTSEVVLTGAGGGGACLAYPANSEPILFDFFADTPPPRAGKELDFFDVSVDFGGAQQIFHIGQGAVAVPGNIAGLLQVHKRLGSLPLPVILEPAIIAAREGVKISAAQASIFKLLTPILTHGRHSRNLFSPNGILLKEGDEFRNLSFADFLEQTIREGADFFYRGEGAKQILEIIGAGGWLTAEALENYRVMERQPIKTTLWDCTLYTNPAPSTGGTLITFILHLLNRINLPRNFKLATLVTAMEVTHQARCDLHLDPNDEFQIEQILNPDVLSKYLQLFRTHPVVGIADRNPPSRGATTHVSIIDSDGNAASVTTTNGEGCGYLIPGLGIMPNNMLGEEDINPLGFHKWTRQRRLPTMIAPTIIVGKSGPELVLGSGGSNRIRSAITQVILNVLVREMDLASAVEAPRFHLEGNVLHCEPGLDISAERFLPDGVTVHQWEQQSMFFGGVNTVSPEAAAGDSRRGGVGLVW